MTFLDPRFQQRAGIESTTVAAPRTSRYEAGPLSTRGAALRQCLPVTLYDSFNAGQSLLEVFQGHHRHHLHLRV